MLAKRGAEYGMNTIQRKVSQVTDAGSDQNDAKKRDKKWHNLDKIDQIERDLEEIFGGVNPYNMD